MKLLGIVIIRLMNKYICTIFRSGLENDGDDDSESDQEQEHDESNAIFHYLQFDFIFIHQLGLLDNYPQC